MKICKNCFKSFYDHEDADYNPARQLGDIYVNHTKEVDVENLCPDCREELGMLNLIGFEQ